MINDMYYKSYFVMVVYVIFFFSFLFFVVFVSSKRFIIKLVKY